VRVEWDEGKRRQNVAKHGVDFRDAALVFEGPIIAAEDRRRAYGEAPWRAIGQVAETCYVVVYTHRGRDTFRIISAWRAGREDTARYQALHLERSEGHAGPGADLDAR
jgi:uncharacterized DUF497 family protein